MFTGIRRRRLPHHRRPRNRRGFVAVELFCALLTGFFLWLLIYQWRRKSIARWRRVAGDHLCTAASTRGRQARWVFFVFFLLALLSNGYNAVSQPGFALGSQFGLAVTFALVLLLGIPTTANIALEVHRRGVFCSKVGDRVSATRRHFVPWNQIAACQWVPKSYGVGSRFDDTFNRLTIAQEAVSPETKAAVTAAVGQFVPVYDHDGALVAEPDEDHRKARWIPWRDLDRPRFQFDLQTLMLLVVVIASAASLCDVHLRSPHYRAISRLEAFDPQIDYVRDDVWWLDFSACAKKPTDDDLVYLEPLTELTMLDLSGAPITDAGLEHLKGLKNLRYLTLANTGVTSQGMKDLQRALPDVSIGAIRYPPPQTIVAPLAKGK
jgi:hypothetical protein